MQHIQTPARPLAVRDDNKQVDAKAKRREKPSALCKTPPSLIKNKDGQSYQRGLCLGEGGFARCFQVNTGDGTLYAAKTIAKASLTNEKTRLKLFAEIRIHRSLQHQNVVRYIDCFEDDVNVYILLEICSNSTLMELVRRRKRLLEVEARYYLLQVLAAVNHMHNKLVIHRDLKLGNIFIDSDMNIKIGDFGLAARLESKSQRRYTVCGTPNYISPEVLVRPHEHSFPADIWGIGVILYAMVFGKPPFQEKDVKVIYERIKQHDLVFPDNARVSQSCIELIQWMLEADPAQRPTIDQVLNHRWFAGEFTDVISVSALKGVPHIKVTPEQSRVNFNRAKAACGLASSCSTSPVETVTKEDVATATRPSASRVLPPSLSPPTTKEKYKMVVVQDRPDENINSPAIRRRHQLAPDGNNVGSGQQNWPKAHRMSTERGTGLSRRPTNMANAAAQLVMKAATTKSDPAGPSLRSRGNGGVNSQQFVPGLVREVRGVVHTMRDSAKTYLARVLTAQSQGTLSQLMRDATVFTKPPHITKWADFDEHWGMAYGLSDGAIGMHFRDGTSMRMDPFLGTYMAYEPAAENKTAFVACRTSSSSLNSNRAKKVNVINFVHKYMDERLGRGGMPDRREGQDASDGPFLYNFSRGDFYMMFVLSDGTMQFNFSDHTKIVIYGRGARLFVIDPAQNSTDMSTEDAMTAKPALDLVYKLRIICENL
ncbi:Cell cycle serine/threonine-protein kinase CDC5/MSD2 [Wickerhamiella sorbophila]|uniref:Serine/threonine-protein kinase n=1 Tax=Wickerhamiella sorbophila TaxID=45607 RepID=A0A2T0FFC9_9ASCO|nr:Cell cycle serine/threonine-protein kinase CDC5/MSD2 [Wickerhamiella sorbophila]PRT53703.1 Cell cycle serine/threonine-protein kinase CDC5/MSD2 [Wickerhamiella sorbophila]